MPRTGPAYRRQARTPKRYSSQASKKVLTYTGFQIFLSNSCANPIRVLFAVEKFKRDKGLCASILTSVVLLNSLIQIIGHAHIYEFSTQAAQRIDNYHGDVISKFKKARLRAFLNKLCPGLDSNQHTLRNYPLKVACLPISPPGLMHSSDQRFLREGKSRKDLILSQWQQALPFFLSRLLFKVRNHRTIVGVLLMAHLNLLSALKPDFKFLVGG